MTAGTGKCAGDEWRLRPLVTLEGRQSRAREGETQLWVPGLELAPGPAGRSRLVQHPNEVRRGHVGEGSTPNYLIKFNIAVRYGGYTSPVPENVFIFKYWST